MIGHETKNGATESVAKHRVCQQLTEPVVKDRHNPAGFSILNRQRPVDACLPTIKLRRQPLEIVGIARRMFHVDLP